MYPLQPQGRTRQERRKDSEKATALAMEDLPARARNQHGNQRWKE